MHSLHEIIRRLGGELFGLIPVTLVRLTFAAVLGGLIGLEREVHHKPAGLRTNMFICFGSAMFTILSDTLAGAHPGDHTRIAAQIIPGIGFIGAGSILHSRGSITGLTSAATLFVVASVGMAAGGGLYLTAAFGTTLILVALGVLGRMEKHFGLKLLLMLYEVAGPDATSIVAELNRIVEAERLKMQVVRTSTVDGHSRVVFSVDAPETEQKRLGTLLQQSHIFFSVASLSTTEHE